MKTTFMHYRRYDRFGQYLPHGGLTLAIRLDGNQVKVAMAECGKKDLFSRKIGRIVAEGRLNSGRADKIIEFTLPEATALKSFVHNQAFVRAKVDPMLGGK